MAETCGTCKYWDVPADGTVTDDTRRDCRVNAPMAGVAEDARWPWTASREWCGRWVVRARRKAHG